MNILLWILQIILAALFLGHGWLFVAPPAEMVAIMDASIPPALRVCIGAAELRAAVALILPGVTRILPWLTVLAAAGLMIVMASASVFHAFRGEIGSAITTVILFALVTFVAYMRWKVKPLDSRRTSKRVMLEKPT